LSVLFILYISISDIKNRARGLFSNGFLPDFQRTILNKLEKYLKELKRIVIIKGPKRTVKTTLLY